MNNPNKPKPNDRIDVTMRHTPGPWSDRYGKDVKGFDTCSVVQHSTNKLIADNVDERSARLIAAAPDCLSALRAIQHLIENTECESVLLDQIYSATVDAVAKATGGAT